MRVIIQSIKHGDQRYDTVGDWQWMKDGTLLVKVSETGDMKMDALLALHEMVEALSCGFSGVDEALVDDWDVAFEERGEPGEHPLCPYREQHFFATSVERLAAQQWGVEWNEYELVLSQLTQEEES